MSAANAMFDGRRERTFSPLRPFYWSVRRELWEHPWIWIAPLVVAAVAVASLFVDLANLAVRIDYVAGGGSPEGLVSPYFIMGLMVINASFGFGAFYCLSALAGERRDRNGLFWRSLPVSDSTAVLAKAAVPLVFLPGVVLAAVTAGSVLLAIAFSVTALVNGLDTEVMWRGLAFPRMWAVLVYGLVTNSLWQAPLFAWFLLVAAWARRAALLWALTPGLLCVSEWAMFRTWKLGYLLLDRVVGRPVNALIFDDMQWPRIRPLQFFSDPGLWVGLALAAAFLAAAVWFRRRRSLI